MDWISSVRADKANEKKELEGMLGTVVQSAKDEINTASSQLETTLLDRDQAMAGLQMTLIDKEEKWLAEKLTLQTSLQDRGSDIESLEGELELLRSVIQQMEASAGVATAEFDRIVRKAAHTLFRVIVQRARCREMWPSLRIWNTKMRQELSNTKMKLIHDAKISNEEILKDALSKVQADKAAQIAAIQNKARKEVRRAIRQAAAQPDASPPPPPQPKPAAAEIDDDDDDLAAFDVDLGLDLNGDSDLNPASLPGSPDAQIEELNATLNSLQNIPLDFD